MAVDADMTGRERVAAAILGIAPADIVKSLVVKREATGYERGTITPLGSRTV